MTTILALVGMFALLAGAVSLLLLVLSYRKQTGYDSQDGPELHPSWLFRDTSGSVYSSRNHRKG